ncbi:MAG: DUF3108 domain-containing protein, partial [Acidobacteria bacterium]
MAGSRAAQSSLHRGRRATNRATAGSRIAIDLSRPGSGNGRSPTRCVLGYPSTKRRSQPWDPRIIDLESPNHGHWKRLFPRLENPLRRFCDPRGVSFAFPLLALLLLVIGPSAPSLANDAPPPPTPSDLIGERLEYNVKWGLLLVASAVLEVESNEENQITFRATARTRSIVEAIYPVRDMVESTAWLPDIRVDRYLKQGRTGRKEERRTEIVFDVENGLAQYTKNGEAREPIEVPPGVQDPLSGIYAFRTLEVDDEQKIELDVTDGKKVTRGRLT